MLEKLRQIENRYSELESKLADPAYYSDPAVFTKLCREQRELQPVVETYRAYTACQAQIAQAEALLSDPELHEIAREEIDLGRALRGAGAGNEDAVSGGICAEQKNARGVGAGAENSAAAARPER